MLGKQGHHSTFGCSRCSCYHRRDRNTFLATGTISGILSRLMETTTARLRSHTQDKLPRCWLCCCVVPKKPVAQYEANNTEPIQFASSGNANAMPISRPATVGTACKSIVSHVLAYFMSSSSVGYFIIPPAGPISSRLISSMVCRSFILIMLLRVTVYSTSPM